MTLEQSCRLADIRSRWMMWSVVTDTSLWEATFFFELLDKKDREISKLRNALKQKKNH